MPDNKLEMLKIDDLHSLKVALQAAVIRGAFLEEELKLINPLVEKLDKYETLITKAFQEKQKKGMKQPDKGE